MKSFGLAISTAAIVVCVRLAYATPPVVKEPAISHDRDDINERTLDPTEMPGDLLLPENADGLARWMENHPSQEMDRIDSMEDREQAATLAKTLVEAVGGMHYDLLFNWLARQQDMRIKMVIFRGLLPRLIRENKDQCLPLGFSLGDSEDARVTREELYRALPQDRRESLLNQQTPEERAWLLSRRAGGLATRNPELCLEMIKDLPKSEQTREALNKLVKAWASGGDIYRLADPVSTVRAVMTIQDMEMRQGGLKQAVFEWAATDPDLAARWTNQLPAGGDRDAAIEGMAGQLATADPDKALEWAHSITDEKLRIKVGDQLKQKASKKGATEP